jgi:hypothetical protein
MAAAKVIVRYAPKYEVLPVDPILARKMLADDLVVESCEVGVYVLGVDPEKLWAYIRKYSR